MSPLAGSAKTLTSGIPLPIAKKMSGKFAGGHLLELPLVMKSGLPVNAGSPGGARKHAAIAVVRRGPLWFYLGRPWRAAGAISTFAQLLQVLSP
jgi:hypothetical protein